MRLCVNKLKKTKKTNKKRLLMVVWKLAKELQQCKRIAS